MSAASAKSRDEGVPRSPELKAAFDELLTYLAKEIALDYVARTTAAEADSTTSGAQP